MAQFAVTIPENSLKDLGISDDAWMRWYLTNMVTLPPASALPSSISGVADSSLTPPPAITPPVSAYPPDAVPEPSTNLGQRVLKRAPTSAGTLLADYDQANAARTTRRSRRNFLADAAPVSLLGA